MSEHIHRHAFLRLGVGERHRLVVWVVLAVFAALLAWFGFRAYLDPELLFQFGNALHC